MLAAHIAYIVRDMVRDGELTDIEIAHISADKNFVVATAGYIEAWRNRNDECKTSDKPDAIKETIHRLIGYDRKIAVDAIVEGAAWH